MKKIVIMSVCWVMGCLSANAWSLNENRITNIQLTQQGPSIRLILTLDANPLHYRLFTLSHPNRFVMDFQKTQLRKTIQSLSALPSSVLSVREGYPAPLVTRVVLDMRNPVEFSSVTYWDKKTQTQKLVIDLNDSTPLGQFVRQNKINAEKTVKPILTASLKKTVVIVLDPGHGGKDPGARGENGTNEKTVVLAIAKRLAALMNQEPHLRVLLTRRGDYFVPLRKRLNVAHAGKADVFIAIHADSYFDARASGASVYALSRSGATSEAARWIAQRDNYSEIGGADLNGLWDKNLRSVLIDLSQSATITDSLRLGHSLLDQLDQITRLHYAHVEQAPFVVLKSPDIPSVLVELGFISNPKEEARLSDARNQEKIAQALFKGIESYVQQNVLTRTS